jgi:hypothetical protein
MLDTLKERLKELSDLPINTFADRIRERTRDADIPESAKELHSFIMVMPKQLGKR